MPPPTPYSAIPLSASTTTVLIATLNDALGCPGGRRRQEADGAAVDASRGVLEVGDDPHRPDLGRARDGSAGEERTEDVGQPVPGSRSAVTVDVSCHTVSKRSGSNTLAHRTVPGRAIRPRSFRSRSTIIAFSALSFTEAVRRSRVASSSASQRPRGAVPFIGRVVSRSPSSRTKSSGEADRIAVATGIQVRGMCAPLRVAEVTVEPSFVALHGRTQSERVVHLVRVTGGDAFADLRDSPVVVRAIDGRHPGVGRRRLVARRRQHGLLPLLEHREPGERQP